MIVNFFKIALRNLLRNRSVSVLNILGLSMGFAASLMILMWIQHEISFNKFFKDSDQLYRVEEDQYYEGGAPYHVNVTPYPSAAEWNMRIPEIIDATRLNNLPRLLFEKDGIKFFEEDISVGDSTFFNMFSFEFILGDPVSALVNPNSIVLTEELANKYFGEKNPLGESITVENQMEFMVTAVIENMPDNSTIDFDGMISFRFMEDMGYTNDSWGSNSILTFIKLERNADLADVGEKMTDIQREFAPDSRTVFTAHSIERLRLHSHFGYGNTRGAVVNIFIFGAIGLFVLAIACINFVNLTTARSASRGKEIGIKKVSGAVRSNMVLQFTLESVFQVFIALFIGLILIGLLLGPFNTLSGKEFDLSDLFKPGFMAGYLLIAIIAGFLSGIYPAFFLSSYKPVDVLKGEISRGKKSGWIRRILVIIQFILSIFLAVSGIVIYSQMKHMRSIDLGYEKENLVYISMTDQFEVKYNAVREELKRNPLIENVSASQLNPIYMGSNSSGMDWEGKDPEQSLLFGHNAVDLDYFETMKMGMVSGRYFSREFPGDMLSDTIGNFIINEEVAKIMGKEDPIGEWFDFRGVRGNIVGVMKNFHFRPVRTEIEPMAFILTPPEQFSYMVIRLSSTDPVGAVQALREIWDSVLPDYPLDFKYVEDEIDNMYRSEIRMSSLFRYFTILAVVIAALGLYGLSSFIAEQKNREIGIRKIMGASIPNIMTLLTREFLFLVIIAAIIGFPVSWKYLSNWLQNFPYKVDLSASPFILVGLGAIILALATVSFQSYRASIANPVDSIRDE